VGKHIYTPGATVPKCPLDEGAHEKLGLAVIRQYKLCLYKLQEKCPLTLATSEFEHDTQHSLSDYIYGRSQAIVPQPVSKTYTKKRCKFLYYLTEFTKMFRNDTRCDTVLKIDRHPGGGSTPPLPSKNQH
jgi:hypothetical protein